MAERRRFELPEGITSLNKLAIYRFKPTQPPFQKNKTQGSFAGLEPTKNFIQQNFIIHYKYCCLTCVFTMVAPARVELASSG